MLNTDINCQQMKNKKDNNENHVVSGTGRLILIAIGIFIVIELLLFWEVISH